LLFIQHKSFNKEGVTGGTWKLGGGGLSKGDALQVQRNRIFVTYCIKMFRNKQGEGTLFFSRKCFITSINYERAYKRMTERSKFVELRNIKEYL
jgi:hypothetical protein